MRCRGRSLAVFCRCGPLEKLRPVGFTTICTCRQRKWCAAAQIWISRATALYRKAIKQVIPVSTAEVAEAAKLLENIYRAVNIALVNEMKMVLTAMGIDVWEVIAAASTKPFGFQAFYPGPGLGGHCIPIDPFYLTWKAREVGMPTRFIELAGEVNHAMPDYVVQRTALALNDRGKAVKGSRSWCWAWRISRMWTTCARAPASS